MISEFAGAVENLADHGREGNDLIGELGGQEIHQITSKDFRSVALCSISFISLSSHYNGLVNGDASAAAAAAGEALGEAQFRYKNAVAWLRAALAAIPNSLRGKEVRPDDWVPTEAASNEHDDCIDGYSKIHQASEDGDRNVVDIFSIHSGNGAGTRWIFFTGNKVNTVPRSGYHFMTVIELQRFTLILC